MTNLTIYGLDTGISKDSKVYKTLRALIYSVISGVLTAIVQATTMGVEIDVSQPETIQTYLLLPSVNAIIVFLKQMIDERKNNITK